MLNEKLMNIEKFVLFENMVLREIILWLLCICLNIKYYYDVKWCCFYNLIGSYIDD